MEMLLVVDCILVVVDSSLRLFVGGGDSEAALSSIFLLEDTAIVIKRNAMLGRPLMIGNNTK